MRFLIGRSRVADRGMCAKVSPKSLAICCGSVAESGVLQTTEALRSTTTAWQAFLGTIWRRAGHKSPTEGLGKSLSRCRVALLGHLSIYYIVARAASACAVSDALLTGSARLQRPAVVCACLITFFLVQGSILMRALFWNNFDHRLASCS